MIYHEMITVQSDRRPTFDNITDEVKEIVKASGIKNGQVLETGGYIRNWDVCALFKSWDNGILTVSQRNRFYQGDELEVVEPGKKPYTIVVESLFNVKDNEYVNVANKATDVYSFKCDKAISPDAIFRVKRK